MKKSKVIFTLMIICLTGLGTPSWAEQMAPLCQGVCSNGSDNERYNETCQKATTKASCQRLANWGCVYLEREEVSGVGFCLNDPGDPDYESRNDLTCKENQTERDCKKFESFGCRWIPPRLSCRLKTR